MSLLKVGRVRFWAVIATVVAAAGVAAGFATQASGAGSLTTVKIAITPYFEYQPWVIAHQLGLDKQQGLNLDTISQTYTTNAVAAMERDDFDLVSSCHSCNFPLYKSAPDMRDWMITNQFKGFIVVGRKGKAKTFSDLSKKVGPAKAKAQILKSFKGSTWTLNIVPFQPLITSALSQAGMSFNDIKVVKFADDSKAALAYIRGVGDYYMGSLPQETKLLLQFPDKFVNVGGEEILGPAGLWYSTMVARQSWLQKNQDTANKLLAIWYRTMRYLKERPKQMIPLFTKVINDRVAAKFTQQQVAYITTHFDAFFTLDEAKANAFDPSSPLYWRRSAQFYANADKKDLPSNFKLSTYDVEQRYFENFLKQKKLVAWVNGPLK